ncbi:MAG: PAS domain S-box protein [Spirochaetales bacterium]|nr:PAS domain S-box protein [Spirochaetales bacterium]
MKIFRTLFSAILIIIIGFFGTFLLLYSINTHTHTINEIAKQALSTLAYINELNYKLKAILVQDDDIRVIQYEYESLIEECNTQISLLTESSAALNAGTKTKAQNASRLWSIIYSSLQEGNKNLIELIEASKYLEIGERSIIEFLDELARFENRDKIPEYRPLFWFKRNIQIVEYSALSFAKNLKQLTALLDEQSSVIVSTNILVSWIIAAAEIIFAAAFVLLFSKSLTQRFIKLNNYLNNILNSMPSIVITIDNTGKVTQWNYKAKEATGLSSEQAKGRLFSKVFPLLELEREKIQKAITNQVVVRDYKIADEKQGVIHYSDLAIYPLVANGVDGAVIRIDDITEKVKLEEIMIQSEKMLSIGGLAAGIAHELNNPLAGIIQNIEVALNRFNKEIPANIKTAKEIGIDLEMLMTYIKERMIQDTLEDAHKEARRAAELVENMLRFCRRTDSKKEKQNLSELLEQTIDIASNDYDLKKKYDFKKIKISRNYKSVPDVMCSKSEIQQVFLNILKNAAQAMHDSETSDPRIQVAVSAKKNKVVVEIENNGPAIPENIRKRIFEPFFTTKTTRLGTGLGLYISYFIIVENHQGEITVHCTKQVKTRFVIRLPLDEE